MTATHGFALISALALASACANAPPSDGAPSAPPATTKAPAGTSDGDSRPAGFSFERYPDQARTDRGHLGQALSGALVAARSDRRFELQDSWQGGPALIVFYRGHW